MSRITALVLIPAFAVGCGLWIYRIAADPSTASDEVSKGDLASPTALEAAEQVSQRAAPNSSGTSRVSASRANPSARTQPANTFEKRLQSLRGIAIGRKLTEGELAKVRLALSSYVSDKSNLETKLLARLEKADSQMAMAEIDGHIARTQHFRVIYTLAEAAFTRGEYLVVGSNHANPMGVEGEGNFVTARLDDQASVVVPVPWTSDEQLRALRSISQQQYAVRNEYAATDWNELPLEVRKTRFMEDQEARKLHREISLDKTISWKERATKLKQLESKFIDDGIRVIESSYLAEGKRLH
ncbi:MAG: hypothetical protein H6832_14970 [Planctomycetes bacterium]|nr:hypothetical protein [Planctomycetota bacterium]